MDKSFTFTKELSRILIIRTLSGKETMRCRPEGWNERERGFSSKTFKIYKLFFSK